MILEVTTIRYPLRVLWLRLVIGNSIIILLPYPYALTGL